LADVYCGKLAGWIEMALGMEVGLIPGNFVLDEDQPPLEKGVECPPQFLAHFCCGQTARCINMPLGVEAGLSAGDFVLDGDPAPSPKGAEPKIFGPCSLWPNG